jgi:hypothetical protein
LHDRVEACRRHLTTAEMSAEVRDEMLRLLTDLDERLANQAAKSDSATATVPATIRTEQPASPSAIERLRDFQRSVEVEHPVLCGLVGNVADALSRMGV